MSEQLQTDKQALTDYFVSILERHISSDGLQWVKDKQKTLADNFSEKELYMAFSGAPRFTGKGALTITEADLQEAEKHRKGFNPTGWTVEIMTRTLLLLWLPSNDKDFFHSSLKKLFETSTMNELVALYSALPVLPRANELVMRCAEGLRTNIVSVFDAIALQNPYPFDYLETNAWNQMFLKAAFLDRPLYMITGVDERANADLARIISDYAHERWAASRIVSPEIWRPVTGNLNDALLEDLKKLFAHEDPLNHKAAALVCHHSDHEGARALLKENNESKEAVENGLDWTTLGKEWWAAKQ